ncbi:hypothetical protein ABLE91_28060 [Aquabacter sp. CN5-332]|uniref:hypothetical protein n=1 Tax=Aquabacter sp. CN5-332 TaxID=3156608 RepID=UPI0032B57387
MKKSITPGATPAAYDSQALYDKAERYIQNMYNHDSDEWEYALWSSLALEFLARAALANVSPTLLAETNQNWSHLYYSLGFAPVEERYSPKSIAISEVLRRLQNILPDFNKEHLTFGEGHTGRRNSELHSGELGFDGVKASSWQPRFYQTCEVLLKSMGFTMEDLLGTEEADVARKLITAAADDSAKAVKGEIERHRAAWADKVPAEILILKAQATIWANRQSGHRVVCPACNSASLVTGEPASVPSQKLQNDEIIETQEYLPTHFECVACGLKISGLSKLAVAGLSDRYKKTQVYDPAEYYAPEDDWHGYEEDNNEP